MNGLPLHPALVHVPLGLAFVIPAIAVLLGIALWRGRIGQWTWSLVVLLEVLVLGAGLVAARFGEADSEKVEKVVPEAVVETHEERAEAFLWAEGAALLLAATVLILPAGGMRRGMIVAAAASTFVVAGLGVGVGDAGGRLVYRYDAARVHAAPGAPGPVPGGEAVEGGEEDEDARASPATHGRHG